MATDTLTPVKKEASRHQGRLDLRFLFLAWSQNSSFSPNCHIRGLCAACGCKNPFHPLTRQEGSTAELLGPPVQVSELFAAPPLPVVLAVGLPLAHCV